MIVDTSAIIAILLSEPEADAFIGAIQSAAKAELSAGSHVEISVVSTSRSPAIPTEIMDTLLAALAITTVPVTLDQARWAAKAYQTYGKGKHRAGLNFSDCFAYALAKSTGQPLLFKGNDFDHTDITSVHIE